MTNWGLINHSRLKTEKDGSSGVIKEESVGGDFTVSADHQSPRMTRVKCTWKLELLWSIKVETFSGREIIVETALVIFSWIQIMQNYIQIQGRKYTKYRLSITQEEKKEWIATFYLILGEDSCSSFLVEWENDGRERNREQ